MKKFSKKLNVILILSLLFALCLTGYILSTTKPNKALAETTIEEFALYDGLDISYDGDLGAVYLSVTQEQYDKLTEPTNHQAYLFGAWYVDFLNPYNIALFRVKDVASIQPFLDKELTQNELDSLTSNLGQGEFMKLYHLYSASNYSFFEMNEDGFSTDTLNYSFQLPFELPIDYSQEYNYVAVFVNRFDSTNLVGITLNTYYNFSVHTNAVTRSAEYVARKALETQPDVYPDDTIEILQRIAGITFSSEEFTVNLKYKKMIDYGKFEIVTEQYFVDTLYALSPAWVYSSIEFLSGRNSIYDYNCVYNDCYFDDGEKFSLGGKIFLQAKDYTYSFDTNLNVGTLEILYVDYTFSDFAVMVRDNDVRDEDNLTVFLYFTDISYTASNDTITMTMPIASDNVDGSSVGIKNILFNSLGWVTDDFTAEDFIVSDIPSGIDVSFTDEALNISFNKDDQSLLADLSIYAIAEIIPDYDCTVNVNYTELSYENGEIIATKKIKVDNIKYSEYLRNYINSSAFISAYGEMINSAISLDVLDGQAFYIYHGITSSQDGERAFTVNVDYTYNTLLKVISSISNHVKYYALTGSSLTYKASAFSFVIPVGYKLSSLTTPDVNDLSIDFNESNPLDSNITVMTSTKQNKVLTLTANFAEASDSSDTDNEMPSENEKEQETDLIMSSNVFLKIVAVCGALALVVAFYYLFLRSNKKNKRW